MRLVRRGVRATKQSQVQISSRLVVTEEILLYLIIRLLTMPQDCVIRKLSSMFPSICSNRFIGTVKERVSAGMQGRAEGSNMPSTHLGLADADSSRG